MDVPQVSRRAGLVGRPGDLVQVAPDGSQLGDDAIERAQFVRRQGREIAQVGPHQHRDIRGGSHAPGRGTFREQKLDIGSQPDVQARTTTLPAGALGVTGIRRAAAAEGELEEVLQERGITESALGGKRPQSRLRVGRNARGNDLIGSHGPHCLATAATGLSCIYPQNTAKPQPTCKWLAACAGLAGDYNRRSAEVFASFAPDPNGDICESTWNSRTR